MATWTVCDSQVLSSLPPLLKVQCMVASPSALFPWRRQVPTERDSCRCHGCQPGLQAEDNKHTINYVLIPPSVQAGCMARCNACK
jgi:hypothetical protein